MARAGLGKRLTDWERKWRTHFNVQPVDTETARRARIYMRWFDHEILRGLWTNQVEIAPGVLRSNHPTPARFERLAAEGLKAVITLRGDGPSAHYWTEQALCIRLGLEFYPHGFSDKHAPSPEGILALIDRFRSIERPFLMHCKSGADRAGLASAIYLMVMHGAPVAEARKMLSLRFFHVKGSKAGVLDRLLDAYEAGAQGRDFETWVRESYDPAALG